MIYKFCTAGLVFATGAAGLTSLGSAEIVAGRTVLAQGHLDIDFDYTGQGWQMKLRHEDKGVLPTVDGLLFVTDGAFPSEGSRLARPEGADWSFIGVGPGAPFWYLPSNERPGIIWPGFAAESTDASLLATWAAGDPRVTSAPGRWITVDLESVVFTGGGDGHVSLWVPDTFGGAPIVFWSTAEPPAQGNRYFMAAGSHNHVNWGFSAPGVYELLLRPATVLADESETTGPVVRLVVVVGDAPDPAAYTEWAALRFSPEERERGEADPAADPGASGVPNLLAFAMGKEPRVEEEAVAPVLGAAGEFVQLVFYRRADLGGSILQIEGSTDLRNWEPLAQTTGREDWEVVREGFGLAEDSEGAGARKVTFAAASAKSLFLRLLAIE